MSQRILKRVFPDVCRQLVPRFSRMLRGEPASVEKAHIERLIAHNMASGKWARSALALDTFRALRPNASDRDIEQAARIASSLEFLQTYFLVIDDIVDESELRRGKTCWYKMPGVGLRAIIHGIQFDLAVVEVINANMAEHKQRERVLDEFHETRLLTVAGQNLDCRSTRALDSTWERYEQVVETKTSHYSFTLPVRLGFLVAERDGGEALTSLTYKLGYLFQAQASGADRRGLENLAHKLKDDFLDCFGDPAVTGKNSNDLAEGKCTWLSCRAMELIRGNEAPADVGDSFRAHFGRADRSSVAETLAAMKRLDLPARFRDFEAKSCDELKVAIEKAQPTEIRPVLADVLRSLQGRNR